MQPGHSQANKTQLLRHGKQQQELHSSISAGTLLASGSERAAGLSWTDSAWSGALGLCKGQLDRREALAQLAVRLLELVHLPPRRGSSARARPLLATAQSEVPSSFLPMRSAQGGTSAIHCGGTHGKVVWGGGSCRPAVLPRDGPAPPAMSALSIAHSAQSVACNRSVHAHAFHHHGLQEPCMQTGQHAAEPFCEEPDARSSISILK